MKKFSELALWVCFFFLNIFSETDIERKHEWILSLREVWTQVSPAVSAEVFWRSTTVRCNVGGINWGITSIQDSQSTQRCHSWEDHERHQDRNIRSTKFARRRQSVLMSGVFMNHHHFIEKCARRACEDQKLLPSGGNVVLLTGCGAG